VQEGVKNEKSKVKAPWYSLVLTFDFSLFTLSALFCAQIWKIVEYRYICEKFEGLSRVTGTKIRLQFFKQ